MSVPAILIGMANTVKKITVLGDKFGINSLKNVNAKQDIILMDQPVYFASMDKLGKKTQKHVNVPMVSIGMEIIAKRLSNALAIESLMNNIGNVFAPMVVFGMDLPAWFNLNAVVGNCGMKLAFDAIVQKNLIGMAITVCYV